MGRLDELERLAELHSKGALTDEEFAREKTRLMGADRAPQVDARQLTTCPQCKSVTFPRGGQCPTCGYGAPEVDAKESSPAFVVGGFALLGLVFPICTGSWAWLLPVAVAVPVLWVVLRRTESDVTRNRARLAMMYAIFFGFLAVVGAVLTMSARAASEAAAAAEHEERVSLAAAFKAALADGKLAEADRTFEAFAAAHPADADVQKMRPELDALRARRSSEMSEQVRDAAVSANWEEVRKLCPQFEGLNPDPARDAHCRLSTAAGMLAAGNHEGTWAECLRIERVATVEGGETCRAAAEGVLDKRQDAILEALKGKAWRTGQPLCAQLSALRDRRPALQKACDRIEGEATKLAAAEARAAREAAVKEKIEFVTGIVGDKRKCDTPVDALAAWNRIRDVTAADPLYRKARSAVGKLERCRKQQEKTLGDAVRTLMRAQRERHADDLERIFLQQGMDARVQTRGKDKTTLKMTYILFNRASMYQLTDGGSMNDPGMLFNAQKIGFKKVVFSNGYDDSWTYTLNPTDEYEVGLVMIDGLKQPLKL